MVFRRKTVPLCIILSLWALASLYFFGNLSNTVTEDAILTEQRLHEFRAKEANDVYKTVVPLEPKIEPIVNPPPNVDASNNDNKHGPDIGDIDQNDANNAKEENEEQDAHDESDSQKKENHVAPAIAIVPVEEREPEVDLDKLAVVEPEDMPMKNTLHEKYQFNGLLSDRIGYRRKIPDSRNAMCPRSYANTSSLPKTSIIICYFNESPSVLIRMVNSIIDRTPLELIQEILLVDDSSEWPEAPLMAASYKEKHPLWGMVKMMRTEKNEGLIRAKVFGAKKARGEVLVFLDSHCEVNQDWLQPLLERIKEKRERVVCPIIDIIDSETMRYVESPVCKGGLNWALTFKWDYPHRSYFEDKANFIRPLRSASMAGGLFAIDRSYFFELGTYDEGMDVWGAENVEISFRIWMCGGELEIIPCSRIGHIFRRKRPYGLANDSMGKNSVRAARVWLDDYLPKFFEARPHLKQMTDYGDLTNRLAIKERLHCKNFQWYLENVYPELLPGNVPQPHELINKPLDPTKKYQLKLANTTLCLTAESSIGHVADGARVEMIGCHGQRNQQWRWTTNGELRPMGSSRLCLDSLRGVNVIRCHNQGAHQKWHVTATGKIFNQSVAKCIHSENSLSSLPKLNFCALASEFYFEEIVTKISDEQKMETK